MTATGAATPQDLVERALDLSTTDGCVVIVDDSSSVNLRWASNDLTTNGVMRSRSVTVVAVHDGAEGAAAASISRTAVTRDDLADLVAAAERSARAAAPAEDAQPLVDGPVPGDWAEPPVGTDTGVFAEVAPALGAAFGRARQAGRLLYGFVEHDIASTYLGTSTGLRYRHVQPAGHIGVTGKAPGSDGALTRSAWVGQATRDFTDVSVESLEADLVQRLAWAERTLALDAGRYDTVLPPAAVADLMIYALWTAGARDAQDGGTVFSRPGGGTRVGEQLSHRPITARSDPHYPGLECADRAVVHASGTYASAFDNGLPTPAVSWIDRGRLAALIQTRHTAQLTGLACTPAADNLVVEVDDGSGSTLDVVAGVERGLLLTCLWYIREVDPQTLLLTGLTRDGVYLVEGGEVVAAVNNFRFNESPISLLDRFSVAGATVPALSREWGDYFPRTAVPPLRVPDFHMSTVSPAS